MLATGGKFCFHQVDVRSPAEVRRADANSAAQKSFSISRPSPTWTGPRSASPLHDAEVNVIGSVQVLEGYAVHRGCEKGDLCGVGWVSVWRSPCRRGSSQVQVGSACSARALRTRCPEKGGARLPREAPSRARHGARVRRFCSWRTSTVRDKTDSARRPWWRSSLRTVWLRARFRQSTGMVNQTARFHFCRRRGRCLRSCRPTNGSGLVGEHRNRHGLKFRSTRCMRDMAQPRSS